jgi:hypothetical protein
VILDDLDAGRRSLQVIEDALPPVDYLDAKVAVLGSPPKVIPRL